MHMEAVVVNIQIIRVDLSSINIVHALDKEESLQERSMKPYVKNTQKTQTDFEKHTELCL